MPNAAPPPTTIRQLKWQLNAAIRDSCGPFDDRITKLLEAARNIPGGTEAARELLRKWYVDYLPRAHPLFRAILRWLRLGVALLLILIVATTFRMWYPYLARTAIVIKLYELAGSESPERDALSQRYFFDPLGKETLDALNSLRRPYRLIVERPIDQPVIGVIYRDRFQVTVTDHTGEPIEGVQLIFSVGGEPAVHLGLDSSTKQITLEADEKGVVPSPALTVDTMPNGRAFTLSIKVLGYAGVEQSFKLTPVTSDEAKAAEKKAEEAKAEAAKAEAVKKAADAKAAAEKADAAKKAADAKAAAEKADAAKKADAKVAAEKADAAKKAADAKAAAEKADAAKAKSASPGEPAKSK